MTGAGTFDAQRKSVEAAGTYTHKSPSGNLLGMGVWIATELVSFRSYGEAPDALKHYGLAVGPTLPGFKGILIPWGSKPTGGLAELRIQLVPTWGASTTAVLQMNSALGDVPHEKSVEGIRISLETNGGEFSEEVGGRVMFLTMPRPVSSPTDGAEREPSSGETETRRN